MASYVLIASRDPFESNEVASFFEFARGLARQGDQVTVFLVQNGVFPARAGAQADVVAALAADGVEVLADEFSLRERGIGPDRLVRGVTPAPIDVVIDHLAAGRKALWN